jgi:hypothetical protein
LPCDDAADPPTIFFSDILETRDWEHVWIVANPTVHKHPVVRHLQARYGAQIFHGGSARADFQFLSAASTLILSPSTFAWWAAFLSEAATVHYPLMPMAVGMPWCGLLAWFDNDDKHDNADNDDHNDDDDDDDHDNPRRIAHSTRGCWMSRCGGYGRGWA